MLDEHWIVLEIAFVYDMVQAYKYILIMSIHVIKEIELYIKTCKGDYTV